MGARHHLCKRHNAGIVLIFVRPKIDTNYGLNNGASYEDALNGLSALNFNAISDSEITICGSHREQLSVNGAGDWLNIYLDYEKDNGSIHVENEKDFCIYITRSNTNLYANKGVKTVSGAIYDNVHIRSAGLENVNLYDFTSYNDGRYGFAVEQISGNTDNVNFYGCDSLLFGNAGFHCFKVLPKYGHSVLRSNCTARYSKGKSTHGFTAYSTSSLYACKGVITDNCLAEYIGYDESHNRTFETEAAGIVHDDHTSNSVITRSITRYNGGSGVNLSHLGNNNAAIDTDSYGNGAQAFAVNGGNHHVLRNCNGNDSDYGLESIRLGTGVEIIDSGFKGNKKRGIQAPTGETKIKRKRVKSINNGLADLI